MIKSVLIIMSTIASLSMLVFIFILRHGVNGKASVLRHAKLGSDRGDNSINL